MRPRHTVAGLVDEQSRPPVAGAAGSGASESAAEPGRLDGPLPLQRLDLRLAAVGGFEHGALGIDGTFEPLGLPLQAGEPRRESPGAAQATRDSS